MALKTICHYADEQGHEALVSDVIKQLEAEAQEARANENRNTHEAALAARFKKTGHPKRKKAKCTNPNCLKTGHTIDKCCEKGGGAKGKAPNWFKELKAKNKQEKGHIAVTTSDAHSTRSEPLAAFIDNIEEPNNTNSLKLRKYFQGRNADGDLSCLAKDTCMVEWNSETTCNLPPATPVFPLTTNE